MPAGLLLVLALLYAMRPWTPSPASRTVAAQRPKRPVSSSPHLHGRHYTVVVLATLLLACGAVGYRAAHAGVSRQMNVAITLDRPLETLPFGIGAWVGEDVELPAGVLRVARNDDQVARRYRHTTTGEVADLYVAYTGRPRTMLRHRPSVCYPAAGWSLLADRQVESAAGTPIRVHEFLKPGLTEHRVVVVNYYVAGGRLTTDEDSFWGPLWRTPTARRDGARYVVQVQVVVDATMGAETAERVAQRLVEDSLADILVLLPESAETSVTREGK